MGVLPKNKMGEVISVRFGEPVNEPSLKEWQVGQTSQERPDVPQQTASAAQREASPMPETPPVEQTPLGEQPIFEVPEEILRGFYEEVVAVGLEDGKAQVFAELTVLQERYASALEQLRAVSEKIATQNQMQIIRLASIIAEKIVRTHVRLNPEDLFRMVDEAISLDDSATSVQVFCSPGDYEYLAERIGAGELTRAQKLEVTVNIDEALEYGDFRIETDVGTINQQVSEQVTQCRDELAGAHGA